jgi:hypothetical protein
MPDPAQVVTITGAFGRFAELDSPLYAEAVADGQGGGTRQVDVTFRHDAVVASARIAIAGGSRAARTGEEAVSA